MGKLAKPIISVFKILMGIHRNILQEFTKKEDKKENIDITGEEFKKWVYGKWSIAPERKMKEYNFNLWI